MNIENDQLKSTLSAKNMEFAVLLQKSKKPYSLLQESKKSYSLLQESKKSYSLLLWRRCPTGG